MDNDTMPSKAEILAAITAGVSDAMPSTERILDAIRTAVDNNMPYPSEVAGAVADGTRDAMAEIRKAKAQGF